MSFVLVPSGREPVEIGNPFDVARTATYVSKSASEAFPLLSAVSFYGDAELSADDVEALAAEAARFLDEHDPPAEHRGIIERIAALSPRGRKALAAGTNSAGGYLIPEQVMANLQDDRDRPALLTYDEVEIIWEGDLVTAIIDVERDGEIIWHTFGSGERHVTPRGEFWERASRFRTKGSDHWRRQLRDWRGRWAEMGGGGPSGSPGAFDDTDFVKPKGGPTLSMWVTDDWPSHKRKLEAGDDHVVTYRNPELQQRMVSLAGVRNMAPGEVDFKLERNLNSYGTHYWVAKYEAGLGGNISEKEIIVVPRKGESDTDAMVRTIQERLQEPTFYAISRDPGLYGVTAPLIGNRGLSLAPFRDNPGEEIAVNVRTPLAPAESPLEWDAEGRGVGFMVSYDGEAKTYTVSATRTERSGYLTSRGRVIRVEIPEAPRTGDRDSDYLPELQDMDRLWEVMRGIAEKEIKDAKAGATMDEFRAMLEATDKIPKDVIWDVPSDWKERVSSLKNGLIDPPDHLRGKPEDEAAQKANLVKILEAGNLIDLHAAKLYQAKMGSRPDPDHVEHLRWRSVEITGEIDQMLTEVETAERMWQARQALNNPDAMAVLQPWLEGHDVSDLVGMARDDKEKWTTALRKIQAEAERIRFDYASGTTVEESQALNRRANALGAIYFISPQSEWSQIRDEMRDKMKPLQSERGEILHEIKKAEQWEARARRDSFFEALREIREFGPGEQGWGLLPGGGPWKEGREAAKEAEPYFPRDWFDASAKSRPLAITITKKRGHYSHYDTNSKYGAISRIHTNHGGENRVGASSLLSTTAHEMAHRMEYADPRITAAEWAYHSWRARGGGSGMGGDWDRPPEGTVKLSSIFKKYGYRADEITVKDEWRHAYTGKVYGSGPRSRAWEIISMGIQGLVMHEDHVMFDDEYRRFVLGLLAIR